MLGACHVSVQTTDAAAAQLTVAQWLMQTCKSPKAAPSPKHAAAPHIMFSNYEATQRIATPSGEQGSYSCYLQIPNSLVAGYWSPQFRPLSLNCLLTLSLVALPLPKSRR